MLGGNVAFAAFQWLSIIGIARLGSPKLLGEYTLGLALSAPILLFANLHLRSVLFTDSRSRYSFRDYFALRCITTTAALAAILVVPYFLGYDHGTLAVVAAVALSKAPDSFSDIVYGLLQKHERFDIVGQSMSIRGALGTVSLLLVLRLTGSVAVAALALCVVWALVFFAFDLVASRDFRPHRAGLSVPRPIFMISTLSALVRVAAPLGFASMLVSLLTNIPRYFIEGTLGTAALGVFAAQSYFLIAGSMVVNSLGQTFAPRMANLVAKGELDGFRLLLRRLVRFSVLLGIVGILAASLFGQQVLARLYGPEYVDRAIVLVLIMLAAAFGYLVNALGFALTALRQFRPQPFAFAAMVAASASSSALLVPARGLQGAALSMCFTNLVGVLLLAILLRIRYPRRSSPPSEY